MEKVINWIKGFFTKKKEVVEEKKQKEVVVEKIKKIKTIPKRMVLSNREDLIKFLVDYYTPFVNVEGNTFKFFLKDKEYKYSFRASDEKYPIEFYFFPTKRMSRSAINCANVSDRNDWFLKSLIISLTEIIKLSNGKNNEKEVSKN